MDMNAIATLISTVGFPIAACCYMAISSQKQAERHKEEMDKVTEAVTDLKIAIISLTEKLSD